LLGVNSVLGHNHSISPFKESPIPSLPTKKSSAKSATSKTTKAASKVKPAAATTRKKPTAAASVNTKKSAKTPAAKPIKKSVSAKKPSRATPRGSFEALQRLIVTALDTNKGEEIVTIDLAGKSSFADAMIIASGRSARHVMSLAHHVSDALKQAGYPTPPTEGKESGDWVLLDAGDVIVHLFRPEVRQFYNLEKMWSMPAVPETVS
jgi:ribosome-associated protein